MATKKKMLQAAAGNVGGAGLDITDVFSTYLYEGNGTSNRQITTNINTSDEGGMVWIKNRDGGDPHVLFDTERGSNKSLTSNTSDAEVTDYQRLTSFRDDGFRLGTDPEVNASNGDNYASWTFRKAPKFFDVITYTGTNATRTLNHNLGSVPGCIMFKNISEAGNWEVVFPNQGSNDFLYGYLNLTGALSDMSYAVAVQNNVVLASAPTSTSIELTPDDYTGFNKLGSEYVAYLFAHNDGDGEFGPDADQDIIKCGSYTGNGSTNGPEIDLGFEPQWLLWKNADGTDNWEVADVMRGMPADGTTGSMRILRPNTSGSEFSDNETEPKPTGFKITNPGGSNNDNGSTYIYMAIRRGPLAQPKSGTEVFDIDTRTGSLPSYVSTFPVDMAIRKLTNVATNWNIGTRLTGTEELETNTTVAAGSDNDFAWDYMEGYGDDGNAASSDLYSWMWKRAPGFCDVVAYTGDGVAGRTVSHNLGVAPEMMWVKKRSGGTARGWYVYHTGNYAQGAGNGAAYGFNLLDTTDAYTDADYAWNETEPTDSSFTLGFIGTNDNGNDYIAYLFATLPGVSKVGSYTGTGTHDTHVIDCGFTSGARFVLLKRTDATSDWFLWDTERGITTGGDSRLSLNTTAAAYVGIDDIRPHPSGFIAANPNGSDVNALNSEWIFYAIA